MGSHHADLTYDTDFRPSNQTIDGNSNTSVTFGYDLDGLLTGAGLETLHRTGNNGMLDSTTFATGFNAWSSQDYNGFGELANLRYRWHGSADTTFIESMIRDNLGRITTLSDQATADSLRTYLYIYTTAGRLKAVDRLIGQTTLHLQRYDYDANGNRTAFLGANVGDTATANYDAQDRMYRYKDTAYSYTKNGELTQAVSPAGTSTYTYDELGNLITAHPAGGPTIAYLIDGQNRRVGRKQNGTLQKIWLYQNGLNVVAELDGAGALRSRFVYGSHANVPDYMVQSSTTYRIISDQLGSVRRVVNAATGEMKQRLEYDAWGNVTLDSNPGFQPFGYAGGLYDPDTKLTRFGARDYDASVGRWTCKDPLTATLRTGSLYTYANADPANNIDVIGLTSDPFSRFWARLRCAEAKAKAFYEVHGVPLDVVNAISFLSPIAAITAVIQEGVVSSTNVLAFNAIWNEKLAGAAPGLSLGTATRLGDAGAVTAARIAALRGTMLIVGNATGMATAFATGFSIGAPIPFLGDCDCKK